MTPSFFVLTTLALIGAVILLSFWQDRRATRSAPPAGEIIDTPEGKVHLITRGRPGEKLPVVLLHGSFSNALDMDLDFATGLSQGRQVFLPDRPGHGFSERPRDGFRIDVQVSAMRAALKAKGVERYIVGGQSYGGAAALVWALAYPEDVAGVVLVAPVSHPWPGGVRWYIAASNIPFWGWLLRRTFITLYARYGARRGVLNSLRGCQSASTYYQRARVPLTFRSAEFKANAQDICRLYEQLVPLQKRYSEIKVPAEVVAGTHDITVVLPIHGRKLSEEMPDCGLDVVEGGGHALHHSHLDRCLAAVARLDERLEIQARSPLESAFRAITAVFPLRTASKQDLQ
jgi:pimeloyl-ACP methyl ester carboxylesterase